MFEREHHRNIALALQALDPGLLRARKCFFGGGTAMALRHGEYRESVDIDFLVSDGEGYRQLRQELGGNAGLAPLLRSGLVLALARDVVTDQYGIRTQVRCGNSVIKFGIVREARIELQQPGPDDATCGVPTLTPLDLAASKLLANADRWADDSVFSRALIDLAMQGAPPRLLREARAKAEAAYGDAVVASVARAVGALRARNHRLDECMRALDIRGVTKAQLWQRIVRVEKVLLAQVAAKGNQ